ncbi:TfoX C-terminal domain-containing protein [Geodermatophilus pulveris]|uniref:TfoX C-terminal domain-containing protein n=1 Tax=Geodermatophilus pulveris TaxID=1564159 RepID=A0A239DA54_9ACTN|nr:TfoX/Sxy family DNA transformation protein [Geodermatophilus pulveris]SNS28744.1 TfoX C-terminal domain-containing protein [Geodermatophilus pulveris]
MDTGEAPARRIRDLRGLGPASERALARVGVRTPEQLDALGAAAAYRLLVDAGTPGVTRTFLWALAGALLDLDRRELPPGEEAALERDAGLAPSTRAGQLGPNRSTRTSAAGKPRSTSSLLADSAKPDDPQT